MTEKVTENIKQIKEATIKTNWRPMMAWMYMAICIFDFIIAPIGTSVFYAMIHPSMTMPAGLDPQQIIEYAKAIPQITYIQWDPLTLKAGGFFHIVMGGILGVTSWTRGQEKIKRLESGIVSQSPAEMK